jgi:electron transport complex protein RnfG
MSQRNAAAIRQLAAERWHILREQFRDLDTLRGRIDYQTYLLAAAGLAASLLLGLGDLATRSSIDRRLAEDMALTLDQVLPARLHDNDLLQDPLNIGADAEPELGQTEVYRARKNGEVTAVAFRLDAKGGYSGPIALMMGVDRDGTVLGVRVITHAETPGLGDKIERTKSDWILSFDGRSLDNTSNQGWKVKKDGGDFDQFAGATITPRAVVQGVASGLAFFRRHRDQLLNPKLAGDPKHE